MAEDVRANAKAYIDKYIPVGKVIYSDGPTAAVFTQITGLTHEGLVANWKSKEGKPPGQRSGIVTCCNSFAGEFSRVVYKKYLGALDPHDYLKKLKMEYAWVAATDDVRPKYGDIVRHKDQHVGVSLDFDGETWNTIEGGQGGPIYDKDNKLVGGHDAVKRLVRTYDSSKLQGWIDLELFVGPAPSAAPQPNTDGGKSGSLWLNQDGDLVHPDAPAGGGGPGFFRPAGVLMADASDGDLPHPWSPAARTLDPQALLDSNSDSAAG